MRIIAEKDAASRWAAWWDDDPNHAVKSLSMYGAMAKLLTEPRGRDIAVNDLATDIIASRPSHIEMVVTGQGNKKG